MGHPMVIFAMPTWTFVDRLIPICECDRACFSYNIPDILSVRESPKLHPLFVWYETQIATYDYIDHAN